MQGGSDGAGGGDKVWELKEKVQTIQHKLVIHDQHFGIRQRLQNSLDACM